MPGSTTHQQQTADRGAADDFVDRVERAYARVVAHYGEPHDGHRGFVAAVAAAKQLGRLQLDEQMCMSDPGLRYELWLFDRHSDRLPVFPVQQIAADFQDNHEPKFRREEIREAAWTAAAQRGFAILANMPEVREIAAHTCWRAVEEMSDRLEFDYRVSDKNYVKPVVEGTTGLWELLLPQLRMCLLADVAAGLMVPGVPVPPDTAEHAAALLQMIHIAASSAELEASRPHLVDNRHESALERSADEALSAHAAMQQHVCGAELLQLVSQLVNTPGSSSSSNVGLQDTGTAAVDKGEPASADHCLLDLQLAALEKLMWHWQPVLEAARQLQQQQQRIGDSNGSNGSSGARNCTSQTLYQQCMEACGRLMQQHSVHVETAAPSQALPLSQVPARLLSVAVEAPTLLANSRQQQQLLSPQELLQLPAAVVSSQLHVLCGALVMQFVCDAGAAGGAAWHQEVPLQTVVLLGVLEQVQGMMAAAAVTQKDVADAQRTADNAATAAACATGASKLHQNGMQSIAVPRTEAKAAAAAAVRPRTSSTGSNHVLQVDLEEQHWRQQLPQHHLEWEPETQQPQLHQQQQLTEVQPQCEQLWQEQQERWQQQLFKQKTGWQREQQQQQDLAAAVPIEPPSDGVLLALSKVSDLIQLIRQFTELNAALNGSSSGASSTSSRMQGGMHTLLSCSELTSASGPISSLYPEPCTVSVWARPPPAAAVPGAGSISISEGSLIATYADHSVGQSSCGSHATSNLHNDNADDQPQQQQQEEDVAAAALDLDRRQQLLSCAVTGALLLFTLQEQAHNAAWNSMTAQLGLRYYRSEESLVLTYMLHRVVEAVRWKLCQQLGLDYNEITDQVLGPAVSCGREFVAQIKDIYDRELIYRAVDPEWSTVHDVSDAAMFDRLGLGSSSSTLQWQWQQQQQDVEDEVVQAIKQGGDAIGQLAHMLHMQHVQPALNYIQHRLQMRRSLLAQAKAWWEDESGRLAWLQQQHEPHDVMTPDIAAAAAPGGSSDAATMRSTVSDWASSSSSALQDMLAGWRAADNAAASACQLCQQEQAGAAGAAAATVSCSVSATDPFRWRKLVWQLLRRLKPSAQAWYVQHYGMCHHCTDERLWWAVHYGLMHYVWLPHDGNSEPFWLATHALHSEPHELLGRKVLQYSRVLNERFSQVPNSQGAALLSQLALLSLSPLHGQLLPPCDVAPLCPSSFGPGINQTLSHQFGVGPLLQPCLGKHGQVRMWHVWWHIGIRRYHWIKQQQEQPDQHKAETLDRQGGSCSDHLARSEELQQQGLAPLSNVTLDQLYSDPAARYYAAGFASKQLAPYGVGLRARAAMQTPHLSTSHRFAEQICEERMEHLNMLWPVAVRPGLEANRRLQIEKAVGVIANELDAFDEQCQSGVLFPPLFRADSQVGVGPSLDSYSELMREAELLSKPGEAYYIAPDSQLLGSNAVQWQRRHELLLMQICDVCHIQLLPVREGKKVKGTSWLTCSSCEGPRYCSQSCKAQDADSHEQLCKHLLTATQRYSSVTPTAHNAAMNINSRPLSGLDKHSSCSAGSRVAASRPHRWHVLDLLQPEPGPLGTDCGALS